MRTVKIGQYVVGDGHPTFIVAEMAWSHDGSREKAFQIVDAAATAGAHAVNLHITSLPDYMVPYYGSGAGRVSAGKEAQPIYKYLESICLSEADWIEVINHARRHGLLVSAMCNDRASVRFVRKLDPDIYMIHASGLCEEPLVKEAAANGKPMFLGIGGATLGEVEQAVNWVRSTGNQEIVLQYGFQSYPTQIAEMNLRFIPTLKAMFGVPICFGDHTDGGSEHALIVPVLAVACGANVIEKHLTHNRDLRGEDFESALGPVDFAKFVTYMKELEQGLDQSGCRPLSADELRYRSVVRKRAVAAVDINPGDMLGHSNIAFKRCDEGLHQDEFARVVGRRARTAVKANAPVTWDDIA